jgi:tripartite-type tricarboxylate transporter receptor subunit TctC
MQPERIERTARANYRAPVMKISDRIQWRALPASLAVLIVVAATAPNPAPAQTNYPNRPVRFVVPFAAGGVADSTARIVADKLAEKLGQRFYVENQPGAGGITAARTVLGAAADGYTLIMLTNGTAVSVSLFEKLPFDPVKDFAPVSSLGFFDFAFVTSASSGFKTLAEFVAAAKARPGALNVGTINVGSTQNLSAELFKTSANIDFTLIPFRGNHEAEVALLQGSLSLVVDSYSVLQGNIDDGKLRALASSGAVRSESTPDLPTVQESGVSGYDVVSWNALFARSGTPGEIIKTLNAALQDILGDAETKKKFLALGIEAKAGTPEAIEDRLKSDIDKWRAVTEKAKIPKQ